MGTLESPPNEWSWIWILFQLFFWIYHITCYVTRRYTLMMLFTFTMSDLHGNGIYVFTTTSYSYHSIYSVHLEINDGSLPLLLLLLRLFLRLGMDDDFLRLWQIKLLLRLLLFSSQALARDFLIYISFCSFLSFVSHDALIRLSDMKPFNECFSTGLLVLILSTMMMLFSLLTEIIWHMLSYLPVPIGWFCLSCGWHINECCEVQNQNQNKNQKYMFFIFK